VRATADAAAAVAEAAEEAAWRTQAAVEQAAADHRRTIANAHVLQADSQIDAGAKLVDAGLFADALEHFRKAVSLNRVNILAHLWTGTCLFHLNEDSDAKESFKTAIALLGVSDYRDKPSWFEAVYAALPNDADLVSQFAASLATNFHPKRHSPSATHPLVARSLKRGLVDIATSLVTPIASSEDLVTQLLAEECDARRGQAGRRVEQQLSRTPAAGRSAVASQFAGVVGLEKDLGANVVERVRAQVRTRVQEWADEIRQELASVARTSSTKSAKDSVGGGPGWAVGVVVFVGLLLAIDDLWGPNPLSPWIALALGIVASFAFNGLRRTRWAEKKAAVLLSQSIEKEVATWRDVVAADELRRWLSPTVTTPMG
jgi:tetratricopeptide (TPR) repeat protein